MLDSADVNDVDPGLDQLLTNARAPRHAETQSAEMPKSTANWAPNASHEQTAPASGGLTPASSKHSYGAERKPAVAELVTARGAGAVRR